MTRSLMLASVLAVLLAGCGGGATVPDARRSEPVTIVNGETKEPGLADIELCDASDYRPMVGSNIAAATFPAGPRLRVFGEDDIVTQEYIPQRTNVVFDKGGTIVRVYCG